jgi:hypothetical protein
MLRFPHVIGDHSQLISPIDGGAAHDVSFMVRGDSRDARLPTHRSLCLYSRGQTTFEMPDSTPKSGSDLGCSHVENVGSRPEAYKYYASSAGAQAPRGREARCPFE